MKKKAFTLIELIAVLVILAILALIVTPLVMNIIRKAKTSADKRSIDAYGRSIELAIAGYLLDNGSFPTSIEQLTIEYTGKEVLCTTTNLNSDSSVYLAGCTVGGRSVDGYTYGSEETITYHAYQVGDHISYNGVTYYVIEDSDTTNDTVKLLKEEPLTYAEMNALNLTDITISEINGYGNIQFEDSVDYYISTVNRVLDVWKNTAVKSGDNVIVRLIGREELINNLGYRNYSDSTEPSSNGITPNWVYASNYSYWTLSQYEGSSNFWLVLNNGWLSYIEPYRCYAFIRPVVELNKSADISIID